MILDPISILLLLIIVLTSLSMWLRHREKARLVRQIDHMRESIISLSHTSDNLRLFNEKAQYLIARIYDERQQARVTHRDTNARRLRQARLSR